MARIKTADLIQLATPHVTRALEVQRDPAVRKAWRTASTDAIVAGRAIATAARSTGEAWVETIAAWRRLGPAGPGLAPA